MMQHHHFQINKLINPLNQYSLYISINYILYQIILIHSLKIYNRKFNKIIIIYNKTLKYYLKELI